MLYIAKIAYVLEIYRYRFYTPWTFSIIDFSSHWKFSVIDFRLLAEVELMPRPLETRKLVYIMEWTTLEYVKP